MHRAQSIINLVRLEFRAGGTRMDGLPCASASHYAETTPHFCLIYFKPQRFVPYFACWLSFQGLAPGLLFTTGTG